MNKLLRPALLLSVAGLLLSACGPDFSDVQQGVYRIDRWSVNEASCASEGPSVLDEQTRQHAVVVEGDLLGHDYLLFDPCEMGQECASRAQTGKETFFGFAMFSEGNLADGIEGTSIEATSFDGKCTGSRSDHLMTSPGADALRIETRTREVGEFAPDSDGFCTTEAVSKRADDAPCTRYRVVVATRISDLP